MPYITILEELMDGGWIRRVKDRTVYNWICVQTEKTVDITISMSKDKIDSLETTVDAGGINGIQKLLKLSTTDNHQHAFIQHRL
jgi:hypothetical protein